MMRMTRILTGIMDFVELWIDSWLEKRMLSMMERTWIGLPYFEPRPAYGVHREYAFKL